MLYAVAFRIYFYFDVVYVCRRGVFTRRIVNKKTIKNNYTVSACMVSLAFTKTGFQ